MKILIAPYAAVLRNGKTNPKNYPYWPEVISELVVRGVEVVQIGAADETRLPGVSRFIANWPLRKLKDLAIECDLWLSVDSFWPHFCHTERLKSGVVIWGQSDPLIFGYPENENILKARSYLRECQFQSWEACEYREDAFVSPDVVIDAVTRLRPNLRISAVPRGIQVAA